MEKKIIYLKAEQSSYVNHEKIHIGDIASVCRQLRKSVGGIWGRRLKTQKYPEN